jgi:hypothetical protein
MKYISIGDGCSVNYNIQNFRGKCESLFFDILLISMTAVLSILNCENIKDILYPENIVKEDVEYSPYNPHSKVFIKNLNWCVSIHDLPINYTDNDLLIFIDKYTRRFNRIIEYIKSNEKICFIRLGHTSDNDINKFIETIKKINADCDFNLVVIHNDKNNNTEIIKQKNLLYIKLNIDNPKDNNNDWTMQYLNWNNIFLDIENNI